MSAPHDEAHGSLLLGAEDLNLLRQWYNAVDDLNPLYLEPPDHGLYARLLAALGWTPPLSLLAKLTGPGA